jgi:hypothetical protein
VASTEMELSRTLTTSQRAFVNEIAAGSDQSTAVIKSGYKSDSPATEAWRLLQQPHIVVAIQMAVARRLAIGSGLALRVLQDFAVDESVDKRLRVVCAKTLLDRAGHIAPKAAPGGAAGDVPLNELSMGDLRALADKLEGEIAGRAKEVSSAKLAPARPQTLDDIM